MSYTDMLIELDLPPLKLRRQYLKLTTLHGILYNYSYFPVNIFNFNNSPYTSNRNLNLIKPIVRTNYFLHSFVPNSVVHWNSLPFSLQSTISISSFKYNLVKFLSEHDLY